MRKTVKFEPSELADEITRLAGGSIADILNDTLCMANILGVSKTVAADLEKVDFDFENFSCQTAFGQGTGDLYRIIGLHFEYPITFLGCNAGGDWEAPVVFILYWDGKKVRAYIPKEGNTWNTKTKAAWGNGPDEDPEDRCYDATKLLDDIKKRLTL